MPTIGLIAVDIDGTLLDSKQRLSPRNAATLRTAKAREVEVVLSTGKDCTRATFVSRMLGFNPHLICSNGALIRTAGGITLGCKMIDSAVVEDVIRAAGCFASCCVLTFEQSPNVKFEWKACHESIDGIELPDRVALDSPLQMTLCGPQAQMQRAVMALKQMPRANEITVSMLRLGGDECVVDVGPADTTKGTALAFLCARLKIERERVAAIGDNLNDYGMLEFAGYSFVVANAPQEMKVRGWHIAPSNDDDGVAWAVGHVLRVS